MEPATDARRGRVAIAIAAGVLLLVIVGVVVLAGGGGREAAAAPPECYEAWNSDPAAVAYGRHNHIGHGYVGALVTYLDDDVQEVDSAELGACAVLFPAQTLDPEPVAAGQILRGRTWKPISELEGVELSRVGELQVLAAGDPNMRLGENGLLSPP